MIIPVFVMTQSLKHSAGQSQSCSPKGDKSEMATVT